MVAALFFYLLAIVCWLGGMIFFSFFTAPTLFNILPTPEAGKVVSTIFPRYYILGYVAGAIAFGLAIYLATGTRGRGWWLGACVLLAAALGLTVYAGAVVRPRIEAARPPAVAASNPSNPDPARQAEFNALHRLSVQLNCAVMVLDALALLATAAALT